MRQVLVTGGTGFIGGRLVERLMLDGGSRVRVLVRDLSRAVRVARFPVEIVHGDVTDPASVRRATAGCDIVFNCAHDTRSPRGQRRSGRDGAAVVSDAVLDAGVARLVHFSSLAVYGPSPDGDLTETSPRQPTRDAYALAKRAGEDIVRAAARQRGLPAVILQPAVVYGPYGKAWTVGRIDDLATGLVPLVDGGTGWCNAVYVDDVVDVALAAAQAPDVVGESFLVSASEPVTWRAFYAAFEDLLGVRATIDVSREDIHRMAAAERRRALRHAAGLARRGARTWLGDPDVVTALRDVRSVGKVVDVLGRRLPERRWDQLKSAVRGGGAPARSRPAQPKVHVPAPALLALYASRTRVRIDKAQERLGYRPRFDFAAGMELTAAYLRWANLVAADRRYGFVTR